MKQGNSMFSRCVQHGTESITKKISVLKYLKVQLPAMKSMKQTHAYFQQEGRYHGMQKKNRIIQCQVINPLTFMASSQERLLQFESKPVLPRVMLAQYPKRDRKICQDIDIYILRMFHVSFESFVPYFITEQRKREKSNYP